MMETARRAERDAGYLSRSDAHAARLPIRPGTAGSERRLPEGSVRHELTPHIPKAEARREPSTASWRAASQSGVEIL